MYHVDHSCTSTHSQPPFIRLTPGARPVSLLRDLRAVRDDLLVGLADLERAQRLEQARAVVRARRVLVLDDLLGPLAVELGARVAQVRLDVDELLELLPM